MLEDKEHQTKKLEGEIAILQSHLLQLRLEADEVSYIKSVKKPQLFGFCLALLFQKMKTSFTVYVASLLLFSM